MSPEQPMDWEAEASFPRVSGDEPQSASGAEQPQKFSPRERG